MGIFSPFRGDVQRIGVDLGAVIGGALEAPGDERISWQVAGARGGRRVRIDLDPMHGVFGVACELRPLGVAAFDLWDDKSAFAAGDLYVTDRLKAESRWDSRALWQMLPEAARQAMIELLNPESSAFALRDGEITVQLGPLGILRKPDVTQVILHALDQLLALAPVLEQVWDIDPRTVGER